VVVLSGGFVLLSALLNALGAVAQLAALQLAAPAAMAMLAWPMARLFREGRERALILLLTASAAAGVAVAARFLISHREELTSWFRGTGGWWSQDAARLFFSISGAMLVSGLISSAALVALRGRILHSQGLAATGEFDAAWTISMNHVTLVLASMQAYYLPALARTRDPDTRAAYISGVLVPAALAASCIIAFIALFKPFILSLFYSHEFLGAARYLRWTLLGDYLKVTSWILSIPMLAAADMRIFLAADMVAWSTFAAAALALTAWKTAAESTAIAFVLMYLVHLSLAGIYARRHHGFSPDRRTGLAWLAGLSLVAVASGIGWRTP
jgi:PST family polysaccharide transporter